MKKGVHPDYGPTKAQCACGKIWDLNSTRKDLRIGICADCHPFFTGKQKFVDTAGRVEKFRRRYQKEEGAAEAKA
jgi:large subunit ribosomal protein L31